jgi:hypothetical protein
VSVFLPATLTRPRISHLKLGMTERTPSQRAASARNAQLASAGRRLRAAEREAQRAAALDQAYAPIRDALVLAFAAADARSALAAVKHAQAELAKVATGPNFDSARSRSISQALRECARVTRDVASLDAANQEPAHGQPHHRRL